MNERLEHADLAYTAWVECGVALGGNDRLGDMVVREISAWALGGSDRHFAWVYSCGIRFQKYFEINGVYGKAQERFPFSKRQKTVTGGAYGNPENRFARNRDYCNR